MASRDSNTFSTFNILQWKSFTSHEGKHKCRQSTKPNKTKKHVVFSGVRPALCFSLGRGPQTTDCLRETSANPTRRPSEALWSEGMLPLALTRPAGQTPVLLRNRERDRTRGRQAEPAEARQNGFVSSSKAWRSAFLRCPWDNFPSLWVKSSSVLERLHWPDEEPLVTTPAVGWAGVQAHRWALNESRSPRFQRLERPLASRLGSSRAPSGRLRLAGVTGSERSPFPPNAPLSIQHVCYTEEKLLFLFLSRCLWFSWWLKSLPPLRSFRGMAASAVEILQEEKIEKSIKKPKKSETEKNTQRAKSKADSGFEEADRHKAAHRFETCFWTNSEVRWIHLNMHIPHPHQANVFQGPMEKTPQTLEWL